MYSGKLRGPPPTPRFWQLRGHPCCAGWMMVNHFESDVPINAAFSLPAVI